jgi:predicted metal-dependent peptidase
MERFIEDLLEPKLDWRAILADFIVSQGKDDYSWRRLNKRHIWRGMYGPSLYSEKISIGFAIDTSGSMGEDELREGFSELKGVLNAFSSYEIHLFACDADIHAYQKVEVGDEIDFKALMKGGGGTDFRPVFDKIEEDQIELTALVYFTDACGTFPESPPEYPVLWVVKGKEETPWGRRCELD